MRRSVRRASLAVVSLALCALAGELRAQNLVSVPFTNGFIGTRASSPGNANAVLTYATLGIARTFFIQSSSTTEFELKPLQGNDIVGTLRIVRTNGTTLDIPAIATWRDGSPTHLIGILPTPASPITFTYGGGSIQITDGRTPDTGTSVGGYVAAYGGAALGDGGSVSGNAAKAQLLGGLNTYLATVVNARPVGPVTVSTLSTSSTTPTLTGTATVGVGEQLTVVVNGVEYTTSSTPAVARNGSSWSLALASPLSVGTYSVTATLTDADGFTLSDVSSDELTITAPLTTVTLGGSFTANARTYDGTTTATGTTSGLGLVGVNGSDQVTIASVTLAFQSAAAGAAKTVVVTGFTLGGTHAAQYAASIAGAPTATATISPKALTITGVSALGRAYDGGTTGSLTGTPSYVGLVGGESFVVAGTPAATFASAAVGAAKPVTVTGYAAPSANYTVTQPTGLTASITAKSLTVGGSFAAADKVHDGSTAATITTNALTLVGVVGSEDVTLGTVTAAFANATVGASKTVTLSGAALAGAAATNYTLNLTGAPTTTASITAAGGTVTLGGSFTAHDKVYDGTTAATGTTSGLTLVGVNGADQVTIASVTLGFQTATVGSAKTVVVTGFTLGGTHAALYATSVAGAPTATATIAPKALTIGGVSAVSRAYDGTTTATLAGTPAYAGLVGGESFAVAGTPTASFATAAVGAGKPVAVTGYAAPSANYAVAQPTGLTAAITARPLTIAGTFAAADRPYDGTAAATITTNALTLAGRVGADDVALTGVTAAFANATAGAGKPVSITAASLAGAAAANYALSLAGAPTTTASITASVVASGGTVTVAGTFTAHDKVYDGTTAATGVTGGLTLAGVTGSDQVTITGVTLAFAAPTAGAGRTVTIAAVTLGGTHAAQYAVSLAGAPTSTAAITPRRLTVGGSFAAAHKMFDGTTLAVVTASALTPVGVVAGETVTLAGATAAFAHAAVGTGKPVTLTGATLAGATAASYALDLAGAPTTTANVTARPVTIGGTFTAADKVADGTTAATIATSGLRLVGVLGGHDVALAGVTAAFADPAVGTGKPVALTGAQLTGAMAGSYVLGMAGAPTATASILAATPPSAPRAIAVTAGEARLTVAWAAPESAGCRAVTSYLVEHSADEGRSWVAGASVAAPATSAVIAGLVNHVAYRVRVAATNPCGTGAFAGAAPVAPIAPAREDGGRPATLAPGAVATTSGGTAQPVTSQVVQDSIVQVGDGSFTLRLHASDRPGLAVPVDSSRVLQLEHGGRATADGSGFAPRTVVTVYLVPTSRDPRLLGTAPVAADGTFGATLPVADTLSAGAYTLQVNGIDRTAKPRTVSVGVEVVPPPPDLVLAATPDQSSPMVGDTITIALTVTNEGRGAATDVVIPRAFREPGFRIVRTTPLEGTYDPATQEWRIGRIDPAAHARMHLTVIVLPPAAPPTAPPGARP